MKKIFSFDAETNGLWGDPFSIAAIVYEEGQEIDKFIARLPNKVVTDTWVKENVLPAINNIDVTHENYEDMIKDFSDFYKSHKKDADCICHMGYIVESHLLREMHRLGGIDDGDAPYPLFDISGNLQSAGEDPTSVDDYISKYNIQIKEYGVNHNPLFDCEVAAKVYIHLKNNKNNDSFKTNKTVSR